MKVFKHRLRPGRMTLPKAVVMAAALAVLGSAISDAAIPSASGTLSACKKPDGSIKLIDKEAGQSCPSSQQLVEWNRQGPAGPPGSGDPATAAFVDRFGTDPGGAAYATGAPCTLGEVLLTASTQVTAGGLPADGRLLPVSQNAALFQLIGATYGGVGEATFAVPDLRAITPDHMTYSICTSVIWPAP